MFVYVLMVVSQCCLLFRHGAAQLSHFLISFSIGGDTEEGDCSTEQKDQRQPEPASSPPPDQSQPSTQEPDQSETAAGEEEEEKGEEVVAVAVAPPKEASESVAQTEAKEEPSSDKDPDRLLDALLADWQEDLEAFRQMEKDEL